MEQVVLVDNNDNPLGLIEKMEAHNGPHLHRAFSVFVFNSDNKMLLQQRAATKYHSPSLWTNTCCSHPRENENTLDAAARRLYEEMGMHCQLHEIFSFIYQAPVGNGLTEFEFDHVIIGHSNDTPTINTNEVNDYKYLSIEEIEKQIKTSPQDFTEWFKIAFDKLRDHLQK